MSAEGCRTPVGLVGLPIITRSASSGTSDGSRVKSGRQSTVSTAWPACSKAACGSVNCGCTTTGCRHGWRAIRVNASAAPAVGQHLALGPTQEPGKRPRGQARRRDRRCSSSDACSASSSHAGRGSGYTLTAKSSSPPTSASPWWRSGSAQLRRSLRRRRVRRVGEPLRQHRMSGPVHVQVGRVPGVGGEAGRCTVDLPGVAVGVDRGLVELVPGHPLPRPRQQ